MLTPRLTLIDPNGTVHDITALVDDRSSLRITAETEQDLLQLTHSDMDLTLFDDDGTLWALLGGAAWSDVYEIVYEREVASGGWARLFAGIVDIPIERDGATGEIRLVAWSYSKLLEKYGASRLKREYAGKTGTTAGGAATCTLTATAGLMPGDRITLEVAGGASETRTIKSIDSSTQVTCTETWTNAFTTAPATLETPYPRSQSVASLAARLFALAGIGDVEVDIAQQLASEPFPSTPNTSGLPGTSPASVLEFAGDIRVYTNTKRYGATTLQSGFADQGADSPDLDWRPYATSPPGSLQTGTDNGSVAVDPATGDRYTLVIAGSTLKLQKNAVDIATVAVKTAIDEWGPFGLDWCPQRSEVWVGCYIDNYTNPGDPTYTGTNSFTKRYNSAGTQTGTVTGGLPRSVRALGYMAIRRIAEEEYSAADPRDLSLLLYDVSTASVALAKTLPAAPGLAVWTLRAMDDRLLGVRQVPSGGTAVAVWDYAAAKLTGDFAISTSQSYATAATVYDEGATVTPAYVCYGGGMWAAVSTEFAGVIPYADFEGMSAAAALRELAIVSAAHFWIDADKVGHVIGRGSTRITGQEPVEIGVPLERKERGNWEWHRRSVRVTGNDENGDSIDITVGDDGASETRLEISVQIPLTLGLASAIASAYLEYLSVPRVQLDETIEEPASGPLRLLGAAVRGGHRYVVLRGEALTLDLEQSVQLVEIGG